MRRFIVACALFVLATVSLAQQPSAPADEFMSSLRDHCGKAYVGRVVSSDEVDRNFATQSLLMHVRECSENEIRVPFFVGEDRSRTWVLTRTGNGLRLKHDHRHADGSEDAVTQYGGDTVAAGTAMRQEFPVDQFSINLFNREGLTASVTNVWAVEVTDTAFAYELQRENRFFRVEFDLSDPVATPAAPWGAD